MSHNPLSESCQQVLNDSADTLQRLVMVAGGADVVWTWFVAGETFPVNRRIWAWQLTVSATSPVRMAKQPLLKT